MANALLLLLIAPAVLGAAHKRMCTVADMKLATAPQWASCSGFAGYGDVTDHGMCQKWATHRGKAYQSKAPAATFQACSEQASPVNRVNPTQKRLAGGIKTFRVCIKCDCAGSNEADCPTPAPKPATPPPSTAPPTTAPPTSAAQACSDFNGNKKGCKANESGYDDSGAQCVWNKKNDKCEPYSCANMPNKAIKCEKKGKKFSLTCFYDINKKTCSPTKPSYTCADYASSKKLCRKLTKMHGLNCKFDRKADVQCADK